MSYFTATGKLKKSRLEDPTQMQPALVADRTRRNHSISQFWIVNQRVLLIVLRRSAERTSRYTGMRPSRSKDMAPDHPNNHHAGHRSRFLSATSTRNMCTLGSSPSQGDGLYGG